MSYPSDGNKGFDITELSNDEKENIKLGVRYSFLGVVVFITSLIFAIQTKFLGAFILIVLSLICLEIGQSYIRKAMDVHEG